MRRNKQTLSTLETVFVVMVVVNAVLPHGQAIDPAHARAAALFRAAMVGIGAVGWTVVALLKRRLPPDPKFAFVPAPATSPFVGVGVTVSPDGILSVTYNSSRADQWRCHRYVLIHRWQGTALLYLFPAVFCLLHGQGWMRDGVPALIGATAATFAAWTAFLAFVLWLQVVQRLPRRDSLRLCTTSLTPHGLQDVVPEKTITYDWKSVKAIREDAGDIYFWVGATNGNFIPRTAFRDRDEAQEFCRAAEAFRTGQQYAWTRAPVQEHATIWPPPPQVW